MGNSKTKWSPRDTLIQDWAHLCDLVFHYRKDGHWIFRGVGDVKFDLKPRIGRPEARKRVSDGKPLPYDPAREDLMLEYFIRAAPPRILHVPQSRLEWLAVAQHHGMFTRLLDWTESLLIAAFFAVKSAETTPVIYAVKDAPIATKLMSPEFNAGLAS